MEYESAIDEAMKMIKAKIIDLGTSLSIPESCVLIKEVPYATVEEREAGDLIVIGPWGPEVDRSEFGGGDNLHDEWTYPVMVAVVGNPDMKSLQRRLRIRRNLRRLFHRKAKSDFPADSITDGVLIGTKVSPGNMIDVAAFVQESVFVSPLIVNVTVKEVRTQ